MPYFKLLFVYIIIPILIFPIYFVVANAVDSLFGSHNIINWLAFDSRTLLVKTFLNDWLEAFPVMFGIFYLIILPVNYFIRRISNWQITISAACCMGIIVLLSFLFGFRDAELIVHGITIFLLVELYIITGKLLGGSHSH